MHTEPKADLDKYLKVKLDPINKKMIEQEKARHKQFLENHFEKYDSQSKKHDSFIFPRIEIRALSPNLPASHR